MKIIFPRFTPGYFLSLLCLMWLSGRDVRGAEPTTPSAKPVEVLPPGIEKFLVPTKSKENPLIPFYVRIPKSYRKAPDKVLHRVMFSCPILNGSGLDVVKNEDNFINTADKRGWFLVSPTFLAAEAEVQDRKLCYYYPEGFSGQAVLDALNLIQKKYPIAINGLLLHGMSGGAQFVHRFAIWAPERVAAVAVNSASWFDNPNEKSQTVGWLVTIGESDPSYNQTLEFAAKLRQTGTLPILRSYIGMTHELSPKVPGLDMEFLRFYDDYTRAKMSARVSLYAAKPQPIVPAAKMLYIGDSQRWNYMKNSPEALEDVVEDERVYLPTEALAKVWGTMEEGER